MASDPFTVTPELIIGHCYPTQGGEQALQRIRMEHHYGKGPFVGRADHDATVAESLHYVDVFWDAWGQAYLHGDRHTSPVCLGGLASVTPMPENTYVGKRPRNDPPICPNCGSEKIVAVESRNIRGWLCPNECDPRNSKRRVPTR
jgi:hypothetical protein